MKKVGIITMYYNSNNYGGVLQAYALQKVISKLGYDCKQISFNKTIKNKTLILLKNHIIDDGVKFTFNWGLDRAKKIINNNLAKKIISKQSQKLFKKRKETFKSFRDSIPHTFVYDEKNIDKTNDYFDMFICGSDQIWKPGVICPEYLLNFVDNSKIKISYAASISKNNILNKDIEYIVNSIKDFNAISIREKYEMDILNKKLNNKVKLVLDPTLLLSYEDWSRLSNNKNLIKGKYIFCYFLEPNPKIYKEIIKVSNETNTKIVSIPFANGKLNLFDNKFGDDIIIDAGPNEFINLIKNAEYVYTDSFHATVFSLIFSIPFCSIERDEAKYMNSRINTLLEIVDLSNRFIKKENIYNFSINNVNKKININKEKFDRIKEESIQYLIKSLEKLECDKNE